MSRSEILKLHKSIQSGYRVKTLHSYLLITEGLADGRMDKHDVYGAITFNRSCNVLKVNPSGKKQHTAIRCQTYDKTEDHIELKLYFNSRLCRRELIFRNLPSNTMR